MLPTRTGHISGMGLPDRAFLSVPRETPDTSPYPSAGNAQAMICCDNGSEGVTGGTVMSLMSRVPHWTATGILGQERSRC